MPSFENIALNFLEALYESLEKHLDDTIEEISLENGVLTMTLNTGKQWVISKHQPTQQLWLSSPLSGAHHFHYAEGSWISTRQPINFTELLAKELSSLVSKQIVF